MRISNPGNHKIQLEKYWANEKGLALGVVLILSIVLILLLAVGTRYASHDVKRTARYKKDKESFYIAETGIQNAINFFNYDGSGNSPGEAANGFDDEVDGSNWPAASFTNIAFGGGTYTVTATDNDDNDGDTDDDIDHTVVLTSTGTRNGVTSTIEALVNRPTFTPGSAITTKGNLNGSGSFAVQGACGSIHTNAGFNQSGVSGTATQGTTASGNCSGASCTGSGAAEQPIPLVDVTEYRSYAHYILKSDGTIEDQGTGNVYTYSGPNWTWSITGDGNALFGSITQPGGLWKVNGTDVADGIFYVEGDINVLNSPAPWNTTIISEGYIDVGASPDMTNYQGGPSPDIDQLFLIAETDLEFAGNPSNTITGMMYAGEQMSISGTVDLVGYVISADKFDAENLVTPESSISGSLTVTYDCSGASPFFSDHVAILSWQKM